MSTLPYRHIFDFLSAEIGLCPSVQGEVVLKAAVREAAHRVQCDDLSTFFQFLDKRPEYKKALFNKVTVPETWFFRNLSLFNTLSTFVRDGQRSLRALSLGCSSGEEPYSLAMLALGQGWPVDRVHIEGVDLREDVLERGRKALYSGFSFRGELPEYAKGYFEIKGSCLSLHPQVRQCVRLEQANVCAPDFWEGRPSYDIIFCRNLLVYFHRDARLRVEEGIRTHLAPGGKAVFGVGESAGLRRLEWKECKRGAI